LEKDILTSSHEFLENLGEEIRRPIQNLGTAVYHVLVSEVVHSGVFVEPENLGPVSF
jgi:hypothetical protein